MNIYVEHMTYNRIMHKGSILCADYESGMFFFYQIRKMKKNLSSSDHISAFVRSLNAFKSTGSFVICVILQKANINYRIKCKMQQIALTMGLVRDYDNAIIMLVTSNDRCIRLNEMVSKVTIMITIVIDQVFVRFYSQERHNLYGRQSCNYNKHWFIQFYCHQRRAMQLIEWNMILSRMLFAHKIEIIFLISKHKEDSLIKISKSGRYNYGNQRAQ